MIVGVGLAVTHFPGLDGLPEWFRLYIVPLIVAIPMLILIRKMFTSDWLKHATRLNKVLGLMLWLSFPFLAMIPVLEYLRVERSVVPMLAVGLLGVWASSVLPEFKTNRG